MTDSDRDALLDQLSALVDGTLSPEDHAALEATLLKKAFEADKKKASGQTRWVLVEAPGYLDIDANVLGSTLDSVLRLFNSVGEEVAFSNDDAAPGEAHPSNLGLRPPRPSSRGRRRCL